MTTKNFSSVVTTQNLPSRVSEVMKSAAIEQLKRTENLRQFGLIEKIDEGAKTYVYETHDDLTAAYDRSQLVDFTYDEAGATESTATIVEIAKGFQLSWKADHLKKLATRAAQTRAAMREVRDREDYKIIQALIASGAVTSTVSATAVLSGTSADPVKDIMQAKRKIKVLGGIADLMFIEDENLEELASIIASNAWYETTAQVIKDGVINKLLGLKYIVSLPTGKLTHGTAVIMQSGSAGCYQMGMAHDAKMLAFDDKDNHTIKVQVFENIVPVVVRADFGAKITGW